MGLTSLNLSTNTKLTTIGSYEFLNSQLTSLDFSHNTKLKIIEDKVFFPSPLKKIDLSKNVELESDYIGKDAFKSTVNASSTKVTINPTIDAWLNYAKKADIFAANNYDQIDFINQS